jgi:hypothetical protein
MTTPKKKRPRDLNQLAASIVADATSEEKPTPEPTKKNPAAVALGRLGGLKGGKARANKLSEKRRQEIARDAANTRWAKPPKKKPS